MIGALDALVGLDMTRYVVLAAGDEIDLDPIYGTSPLQFGIAVLVAIGVIVFSALLVRFYSSRILEGEQAEHARAITAGLRSRDRNTIRIAFDEDVGGTRGRLRALFDDDFSSDVPTVLEGLREVRGVWLERRRAASAAVKGEIPALARALSLDGMLYLLVGAVAVVSLDAWGAFFTTSSEPPAPGTIVDRVATLVVESTRFVVETAASFPFAGDLWGVAFIAAVEGGSWLYDHPLEVGSVLLVGSLVIWVGDRLVADDVEPHLYRSRPRAAFAVLAIIVATWATGVGVATAASALHNTLGAVATAAVAGLGAATYVVSKAKPMIDDAVDGLAAYRARRQVTTAATTAFALEDVIEYDARRPEPASEPKPWGRRLRDALEGFPTVDVVGSIAGLLLTVAASTIAAYPAYTFSAAVWGATVGLLASLVVFVLLCRRELRGALRRLWAAHEQADADGVGPTGTTMYVAARKAFGALGAVAGAIVPIYAFHAITTGKAATIVAIATAESSPQVKATFAFVALALVAFAVVQTRPAWGELASALRFSLDRQGLRLALKTRGLPLLAIVLAFFMLWGSGFFAASTAFVGAILVGLVVRGFTWFSARASHAYYRLDTEPAKPGRVLVEGTVVEDARGREIAVASLNGTEIAAPVDRLDAFVDQIVADVESIFEHVRTNPSVYRYYHDRIQDGRVDFDAVLAEYRGRIARQIDVELEKAGRDGLDEERLDELLTRKFDEAEYRRKKLEKRKKTSSSGIVIYGGKVRSN